MIKRFSDYTNEGAKNMRGFLQRARDNGHALAVYAESMERDRFCVGTVLGVSEQEVLLALVCPEGRYDGYRLMKIDDVLRVNECGQYERRVMELYAREDKQHAQFPIDEADLMVSLLAFAKKNRLIVRLEFFDADSTQGFYDERLGEIAAFNCLCDFGEDDGKAYVRGDEIRSIDCDGRHEQFIKRLYEMNINA
jgi:hypothetical protein